MATAEWTQLYDRQYRKSEIYDLQWENVSLDKYVVAGAPFGGPIALIRDERKVLLLGNSDDGGMTPRMRIFTSAGREISSFQWSYKGLVKMGWTDKENLVCALEDGTVIIFSVHGVRLESFHFGEKCRQDGIAECHIWPTGMVVRTGGSSELHCVTSFEHPRPYKLAEAGLSSPPTCMAVVPPALNETGHPQVFLGTAEGSIIVADNRNAVDQELPNGPFNRMVVSPTGKVIACFNDEGTLFVMGIDFAKNYSKFGTSSKLPPKDVVWCGEDSVILYWDKILLMVGPFGDFVKYSYDEPLSLVTECDGVRILTETQCEFLQRVPDSTESIFKIGSTSPPALLYDAREAFDNQSVVADSNIRAIQRSDKLNEAISDCLNAAMHEFDVDTQRKLLSAASYGKLFSDTCKADEFVDMCRILRVLNAVRHADVGIPLTFAQFQNLNADAVVERLVNRHQHLLALRISQFLRMKPERVLVHWACAKINSAEDEDDAALGQLIVQKLKACPGVSFAKIANTAYENGRGRLAIMLLEYEPRACDQVDLLINMQQDAIALDKAIASCDTDLVYQALLHIHKTMDYKDFFHIVKTRPLACNLFVAYHKQRGVDGLSKVKKFHYHMQKTNEAANVAVREAYHCEDWKERMQNLQIAMDFYKADPGSKLIAQSTSEQIKLLDLEKKRELDSADGARFVDKSVSELIEHYVVHGDLKKADKLKSMFKVPEKRFWHIQVRTLAKCRAWDQLADLVKNRKKTPPIGFTPFVEACVEQKAMGQAAKYIERLPDAHDQMEWLCNIGYWKEAADVAAEEKDVDALQLIGARCREPTVIAQIEKALNRLA